jgi:hypothetical protein
MPVLRTAVVAASVAWTLLLVVVPFLASRPHASALGTALVVAVYGVGSLICHQLPERSYRWWGAQMPVCARCAGIYLGAAAAAVFSLGAQGFHSSVGSRSPERLALHRLALRRTGLPGLALTGPRLTLALGALPTLATLVYEWTTGQMPANWIRAASGMPLGAAGAWLVVQHALLGRAPVLSPFRDEVN